MRNRRGGSVLDLAVVDLPKRSSSFVLQVVRAKLCTSSREGEDRPNVLDLTVVILAVRGTAV